MVAHNKNYQPVAPLKPARNPRIAEPVDKVNPLHESDLICELADPSTSLEELCAAHEISLEALSLWMARPDVSERLDLVQTTAMNRARFIGRLTLPTAAQSAANIINAHKLRPQKPTIDSAFNSELHRANESMLKAARFLQRLTAEPAPRRARNSKASPHVEDAPEALGQEREHATTEPNVESGTNHAAPALQEPAISKPLSSHAQTSHQSPRDSNSPTRRAPRIQSTKPRKRTASRAHSRSRINASSTSKRSPSASTPHLRNTAATHTAAAPSSPSPIPRASAPPPHTSAQSPPPRAASD